MCCSVPEMCCSAPKMCCGVCHVALFSSRILFGSVFVHCNALQHTICTNRTCCALQRTATHYLYQQNTLCIATHCNTLFVPTEHVVHCNALQHTICTNRTCCALQRTATHYLHQQKTHCNTLFVRTRSPRVSISAIQSHCGDYICELQHTSAHCNTFSAHCNAFVAHCNTLQFTTSNNRT